MGLRYVARRLTRSPLFTCVTLATLAIGEISIDGPVLLFTLAISLAAGVLFGAIPVIKYAGPSVAAALRAAGRTLSQSKERHRARSALVVVQVELALALLISY